MNLTAIAEYGESWVEVGRAQLVALVADRNLAFGGLAAVEETEAVAAGELVELDDYYTDESAVPPLSVPAWSALGCSPRVRLASRPPRSPWSWRRCSETVESTRSDVVAVDEVDEAAIGMVAVADESAVVDESRRWSKKSMSLQSRKLRSRWPSRTTTSPTR